MSVGAIESAVVSVLGEGRTYHYHAPGAAAGRYAVWGEIRCEGYSSDGLPDDEIVVVGQIWYYTDREYDTTVDALTAALSEAGAAWRVTDIGYDDQRERMAYVIEWRTDSGQSGIY